MDNTFRKLAITLGPWLGVALLVLAVNAGANHVRNAQEEIAQAARGEAASQMGEVSESGAEAPASEAVTATESASSEVVTTTTEVTASETVTEGEVVASETVTETEVAASGAVTETEAVVSEPVTETTDSAAVTGADAAEDTTDSIVEPDANSTVPESQGMGGGMGGGMGQGMGPGAGGATRMFHMTPIPEEYAGLTSPTPYSEESIARGEPVFQLNCSPCHGESGMGDGPAAVALDPAPPPIAMTSQMLGDDYLFWRISEGGAMDPFNSAMPSWKAVLDEDTRWDVINYVRSLGRGDAAGSVQGGGPGASAEAEAQMRAEVLASAVEQGVLTQEQADLFDTVHGLIDDARAAEPDRQIVGTMRDLQDQILQELVADGTVTEEDAQTFNTVLDALQSSDLMQ